MVKDPPANAGDADSIPGSGRSPGEGNGNPFQYSCLGNLMDKGATHINTKITYCMTPFPSNVKDRSIKMEITLVVTRP